MRTLFLPIAALLLTSLQPCGAVPLPPGPHPSVPAVAGAGPRRPGVVTAASGPSASRLQGPRRPMLLAPMDQGTATQDTSLLPN